MLSFIARQCDSLITLFKRSVRRIIGSPYLFSSITYIIEASEQVSRIFIMYEEQSSVVPERKGSYKTMSFVWDHFTQIKEGVLQVPDGGDVVGDDYISISLERVLDDYISEV